MAVLDHPNLPAAIDYGTTETGQAYLVMKLVSGSPLGEVRKIPLKQFYPLFVQCLRALSFIHDRGFLHRDIKPSNVLVQWARPIRAVLLDFGLMERIGQVSSKGFAGTPSYMAPEVFLGHALDPRTDLYALGIAGFSLLSGRLPFEADHMAELIREHQGQDRPSLYPQSRIASAAFSLDREDDGGAAAGPPGQCRGCLARIVETMQPCPGLGLGLGSATGLLTPG